MNTNVHDILLKIKRQVDLMDEVHLLPDKIELAPINLSMGEWRELAKSVGEECEFCNRPLKDGHHLFTFKGKVMSTQPYTQGVDKETPPA